MPDPGQMEVSGICPYRNAVLCSTSLLSTSRQYFQHSTPRLFWKVSPNPNLSPISSDWRLKNDSHGLHPKVQHLYNYRLDKHLAATAALLPAAVTGYVQLLTRGHVYLPRLDFFFWNHHSAIKPQQNVPTSHAALFQEKPFVLAKPHPLGRLDDLEIRYWYYNASQYHFLRYYWSTPLLLWALWKSPNTTIGTLSTTDVLLLAF